MVSICYKTSQRSDGSWKPPPAPDEGLGQVQGVIQTQVRRIANAEIYDASFFSFGNWAVPPTGNPLRAYKQILAVELTKTSRLTQSIRHV